ncbi:MAG: HNH endonuclease [Cyclobacteriaceae bacterium]|nr:HNH endonuclease [Cyclobacteriaceae bacterium]
MLKFEQNEASPMDDFTREAECTYKDEHYSVRDNGAVLRHSRPGKQPRPTDNQWTFGNPNIKTGYMEIGSARVHIIVATAFYGAKSTKVYVVDHLDTNRRNNRLENLRWLTRLENVLKNDVTRKKIELACGCSIEEFLADPAKFRDRIQEPNVSWMRTVSPEEAKACLQNMQAWAKSDKLPSGGSLGAWVFKPLGTKLRHAEPISEVVASKTFNAVQKNWRVPSEFPCCPQGITQEPITAYYQMLNKGSIFCNNDVYTSIVLNSAISEDGLYLYVITESTAGEKAVKPWGLAKIAYENGRFVHISLGSFFTKDGAEKRFCLAQGLEWTGGDSIDDYC